MYGMTTNCAEKKSYNREGAAFPAFKFSCINSCIFCSYFSITYMYICILDNMSSKLQWVWAHLHLMTFG